jgi:hypothetical protein
MPKSKKDVREIIRRLNAICPSALFVVKSEEVVEDWKQAFERVGFICKPFNDGRRIGYEFSNGRSPPQLRSVKVLRWVKSPSEKAAATDGETEADQEAADSEAVEKAEVSSARD